MSFRPSREGLLGHCGRSQRQSPAVGGRAARALFDPALQDRAPIGDSPPPKADMRGSLAAQPPSFQRPGRKVEHLGCVSGVQKKLLRHDRCPLLWGQAAEERSGLPVNSSMAYSAALATTVDPLASCVKVFHRISLEKVWDRWPEGGLSDSRGSRRLTGDLKEQSEDKDPCRIKAIGRSR